MHRGENATFCSVQIDAKRLVLSWCIFAKISSALSLVSTCMGDQNSALNFVDFR